MQVSRILPIVGLVIAGCASHALVGTQKTPTLASSAAEAIGEPAQAVAGAPLSSGASPPEAADVRFSDAHLHLLNYVQHGITMKDYLGMVGDRVDRAAVFGLPLQQKWDHFVSGDRAPDYYLLSDAALYYYSFVDAMIAAQYMDLTAEQQQRIDPLLCGFNPTDMYAPEHIERVLRMYPGVFAGIGEFSIHKEFVSSKITGHTASLRNPALDAILDKAEEVGLVVLLHCDVDTVRSSGPRTSHYDDLKRVLAAHPGAPIVWAHTGLGRYVKPTAQHVALLEELLADSRYDHVALDLAWDEVAKWVVEAPEALDAWAALIRRHPTRFLFGSDAVAPKSWNDYVKTYVVYTPLWRRLDANTRALVVRGNYHRIFDEAIPRIRAWERAQTRDEGRDRIESDRVAAGLPPPTIR